MLIKKPADIASSEITPQSTYTNRRQFILGAAAAGGMLAAGAYLSEMHDPSEGVSAALKLDYSNAFAPD